MWWDKLVLRIVGVCMYHSSEGSRSEFELVYVVVIWCMGAYIWGRVVISEMGSELECGVLRVTVLVIINCDLLVVSGMELFVVIGGGDGQLWAGMVLIGRRGAVGYTY